MLDLVLADRDGIAAVEAGCVEPYAAMVLDLSLPRLDGIEVLARLRRHGARLPVLILTARDALGDRVRGLDGGADDYVVKPVDLTELTRLLVAATQERAVRINWPLAERVLADARGMPVAVSLPQVTASADPDLQ